MKAKTVSSRRRFFWKAGAALSAPLAVGASSASAETAEDLGSLKARLKNQDELNRIRALHQSLAQRINSGAIDRAAELFLKPADADVLTGISRLVPADFGENDSVNLANDGKTATAESHCTVETRFSIPIDCTLAEMAHQQGGGILRRSDRRVLHADLINHRGAWKIRQLTLT